MNKEQMHDFLADKNTKLVEAMRKIDENAEGILFVVVSDSDPVLCGVLTDGDIRRWLLKTGNLDASVNEVMNRSPQYVAGAHCQKELKLLMKKRIYVVPVVNVQGHIIDIIFLNQDSQMAKTSNVLLSGVPVVIMAGGKGTRLYPYTKVLPKPLIPIGDIPIVERIMDCYYEFGVHDFLMTVNYRKNMIQSYFSEIEKDYNISFIEEEKPLGTAGSLKLIDRVFVKPLFVTNCDTLIHTDYVELYKYHEESGNAITLVASLKNDVIPYGVIYPKENGEITKIEEKPKRSYFINTGMYIINPDMINLIPPNTFFHMTNLVEKAKENGYKVGMYPISENSFLDMGEFEEMKRMQEKLQL